MSSDEASYFLNLAVIGGTLLALSFVTLQLFLSELLKRYEKTGLAVFRSSDLDQDAIPHKRIPIPYSLADAKLFDGDPLVIFMAFSVAVTWIQFLVPLVVGLTTAWLGDHLVLLAIELSALLVFFEFSFSERNQAIKRLKPYLTRDERFWPVLGAVLLALYIVAAGIALTSGFADVIPAISHLTIWNNYGISNYHCTWFVLKMVCILSLLVGTYTTNKDMFIFFKSVAIERMHQRWLDSFVQERFPNLKKRVELARSNEPAQVELRDLEAEWNDGCPKTIPTHDALKEQGSSAVAKVWQNLIVHRTGTPGWMLDIPRIANWEARVEEALRRQTADTPLSVDAQLT